MNLTFRQNKFPYQRSYRNHRFSLGNDQVRYNSDVKSERKKFYINSTRNSEDIPEWMSRTQSHYHNSNRKIAKSSSLFQNPEIAFLQTNQKWAHENVHKQNNVGGQFEIINKQKCRNKWQLKDHTFSFDWPKRDEKKMAKVYLDPSISRQRNVNPFFKQETPKYGIKQSPLHRQRETPIKIGHNSLIDSTYVQ